ncbi:hypothetical protein [Aliihoeflea sp. PC F10.4]
MQSRRCAARRSGRFVRMVGGVVAMRMTCRPFVVFSVVVAMPVLGDLRFELGVPFGFGDSKGDAIVGRGVRGVGQKRAERHRKSEDEAQHRSVDPVRHD